jgi:hypothetical protein
MHNKQALIKKILDEYLPVHVKITKNMKNQQRKNKAIANFMEWVRNYTNRANNPTNDNIRNSYLNRFR